ncbi:NifB/NifX family molybdenum-iron cluster-binding protein [Anaerobium acetethylicum]|uniref:Predicted Fe-Mo cluster-binding protein, NifX family n=1 Tax=Anaerobium acetethylicum TaxID=1619234 RepID=A0A1D3TW03_9FIRM|nr:NifB/NifX family molybdenum-iron cluster-binding protein [Anaerobium acetethylicum]SCP98358.1 Predicted Fe-Mo cluster-binding protein, NifX family [Anaerobium acetethylicum]
MKIAIPVNEKSMDTSICISFGRTPYFMIYDTETKESQFLENVAATSQGGAGIAAAQALVDSGAKALLTPRCGENAAQVLTAAGMKIYKTMNDSVSDNINAFVEGKLSVLDEIHSGFHGHGGN